MAYFTDFLNRIFTPSEGMEWKYEMGPEPDRYSEEFYDGFGAQPTYTLVPKRGETLSSAPPSVYNRPARQDIGPKYMPQEVEAHVDVGLPMPMEVMTAPPAAPAGRNDAAQQQRVREAKANRAANQLRGGASPAAQASEDYYRRNLSGRNLTTRGGPLSSAAPAPLEGTLEPRRAALSQTRPALPRPVLEGEVVRRSLTGPGGAGANVGTRTLPQDPAWAARMLQFLTSRSPQALMAGGLFGASTSTMADELGGMPMAGFSFVPAQPDFTLGGMLRPQAFDNVNDILIDQYLEGISPWADVTYYK